MKTKRRIDGFGVGRGVPAEPSRSGRDIRDGSPMRFALPALCSLYVLAALTLSAAEPVRLMEADVTIPTYLSGPPDPNPMFFFGRQSQGAEGRIYPYPLYDNLTNVRGEKRYHAVTLENEFVKITVLPEVGGRLFSAIDKTNGYDFVYEQHVIKPALIGLIGAWISGGIEWNIPHHHRASTFLPVQWRTEENADGSKTIWVGELEVRHRMRWAVGYTLHPGSSVLTCKVRIVNRTPVAQTMLCFANVAVHATNDYQIVFPPRTQWVTFHSKNQFSEWPISHQRYSGADFTSGVDVSWYKNHFNANSMFAWNYEEDFFAGYDHGREAGTMSVADHHIVPGKKFWTWGNGPRGRMWDEILTDNDGPYIELMVGAYSDNQPDYSWLAPFETRAFEMHWYPIRKLGGAKNANLAAAVNLEVKDGTALVAFNATRTIDNARIRLTAGKRVLSEENVAIGPAAPYTKRVMLPVATDTQTLRATLLEGNREVIGYTPVNLPAVPQPLAYTPPPAPTDIGNNEELFLAGQRADQFHSPTLDADPFWEETLRRDPRDIEANTGMGRLALRRAEYVQAENHFRAAISRLTAQYTTPKNAESLYYLALALNGQGRFDEAYDTFFKAAWAQEWKSPAYFGLAELACRRGDFAAALEFAGQSLDANALNVRAYAIEAAALRHLGRFGEVEEAVKHAQAKTDPLDVRLLMEARLANHDRDALGKLARTFHDFPNTALETAVEYGNAGLWADGENVLRIAAMTVDDPTTISPLIYYLAADFAEQRGDSKTAADQRAKAIAASPAYVFPFEAEFVPVLRRAMAANPNDARAPYYLGNLLFDWQPTEAVQLWEKSVAFDPRLPVAWRNLAQAYAHQPGDAARTKAIAALEQAVALPNADATDYAELDQLYDAAGTEPAKRLAVLAGHRATVIQKDEGRMALISLETFSGHPDDALSLLMERTFSVWEGGTRFNTGEAWTDAHIARGLRRLAANQPREALGDFEVALKYPANLRAGERVGSGTREAEISYWTGVAREAIGAKDEATAAFKEAAADRGAAVGGRSGRGAGSGLAARVGRYYQALALRKLGEKERADAILRELVSTAASALAQVGAVVDPNNSNFTDRETPRQRLATAHYLAGLGHAGLGEKETARTEFQAALAAKPDHLGARLALAQLDRMKGTGE